MVETDDLAVACRDLSNVHVNTDSVAIVNSFRFVRRDSIPHNGIPSSALTFDGHGPRLMVTIRVFVFAGGTEPAKFLQPDVLPGKLEMTWFGKRHRSCSIL